YVSTVDSGNLSGHLLTLRPGLAALADAPILGARWLEGLEDTFRSLIAAAPDLQSRARRFQQDLEASLAQRPSTLAAARGALQRLAAQAAELAGGVDAVAAPAADTWTRALERQCREILNELDFLAPPALPATDSVPTLRELAAQGGAHATERLEEIVQLARQAGELAQVEYGFLYDDVRHLLAIGYNVGER